MCTARTTIDLYTVSLRWTLLGWVGDHGDVPSGVYSYGWCRQVDALLNEAGTIGGKNYAL